MKYQDWQDRRMARSDLSQYLTHLTRDNNDLGMESYEVLFKILKEKKLIGSTTSSGFICGSIAAVCFQDAPLQSVGHNVWHEQNLRKLEKQEITRYQACGLMFQKNYIYKKGGRPVIYDNTDTAKKYLPENEWWRIVKLELGDENIVDWTHEREWRIPNDLEFDLKKVAIILANQTHHKKFIKLCLKEDPTILTSIGGIVNLSFVF